MAAEYIRDPLTGIVHLVMPAGDNEFTVCNRDSAQAVDGGFEGAPSEGPSNCLHCRVAVGKIREGLRGTRWARVLRELEEE